MDYLVRHSPQELESTCYVEIGPGAYAGKHWQDGFTFVPDEAFAFAQGVVSYNFPSYDPYGINELPSGVALAVAAEIHSAIPQIGNVESAIAALRLSQFRTTSFQSELRASSAEIGKMLGEVASALHQSAQGQECVCILGM